MPKQFDRVINRTTTSSQKWEKYANQDILPMWVADTDFMAPPGVIDALRQRVDHGIFGYTTTPTALNEAVTKRLQKMYGWRTTHDDLVWLPGLVCGLNLACRAVGSAGDEVVAPSPIYPPFFSSPRLSERGLIKLALKTDEQGRASFDLEALEASLTPTTKLLLFCNPHNPGGTVYRREELQALADIVIKHDLIICSDEIHCDLILDPDLTHTPIAALGEEIAQRTITLMAPSKTFNIAGLACSFAVIQNPDLRKRFLRVMKGIVPDVNLLGYTAALAAYEAGDDWNEKQLTYLRGNRDFLMAEINRIPGLSLAPIEATYLAWINVSGAKLDNPPQFFESAGVGMSPGRDFGDDRFM
ncbi:MAG: MalY/PatB family protein [Pontibacterium sp.]